MEQAKRYTVMELGSLEKVKRVMLKDTMNLTGAEISANCIPAGKSSPFVHAHKRNEEIYLFTRGKGLFWLDGNVLEVREGTAVKVDPAGQRAIKADDSEALCYFCIQVDANSLVQATREDGLLVDVKPTWEKS